MDKYLRRLEAVMIVCDKDVSLTLTGTGDVIEPADGVIGIGSGGHFATAAATALMGVEGMQADEIGRRAMTIAANMCVYTVHARLLASGFFLFIDCRYADVSRCHLSLCVQNHNFIELELTQDPKEEEEKPSDWRLSSVLLSAESGEFGMNRLVRQVSTSPSVQPHAHQIIMWRPPPLALLPALPPCRIHHQATHRQVIHQFIHHIRRRGYLRCVSAAAMHHVPPRNAAAAPAISNATATATNAVSARSHHSSTRSCRRTWRRRKSKGGGGNKGKGGGGGSGRGKGKGGGGKGKAALLTATRASASRRPPPRTRRSLLAMITAVAAMAVAVVATMVLEATRRRRGKAGALTRIVETPEEIAAYRDARRRNWPTRANVERKAAEEAKSRVWWSGLRLSILVVEGEAKEIVVIVTAEKAEEEARREQRRQRRERRQGKGKGQRR